MNEKNTLSLGTNETLVFPKRVVAHWRRFSSGLWRVPEGDIQAAYCADTFPKVKVFMHEGRLFANCGSHFSGAIKAAADCYPLIPVDEYRGPEPTQFTYEGREAAYQGAVFKLGPKVVFESSDPTVEEWRGLFRVLFADGGMFAHGVTYREFLEQRLSPKSQNEQHAQAKELADLANAFNPRTQAEMRQFLDAACGNSRATETQQMDFGL